MTDDRQTFAIGETIRQKHLDAVARDAARIATQQEAIDELVDELNALSDWASLMQSGERSDWGAGADKAYADMEERLNAIIDKHGERT